MFPALQMWFLEKLVGLPCSSLETYQLRVTSLKICSECAAKPAQEYTSTILGVTMTQLRGMNCWGLGSRGQSLYPLKPRVLTQDRVQANTSVSTYYIVCLSIPSFDGFILMISVNSIPAWAPFGQWPVHFHTSASLLPFRTHPLNALSPSALAGVLLEGHFSGEFPLPMVSLPHSWDLLHVFWSVFPVLFSSSTTSFHQRPLIFPISNTEAFSSLRVESIPQRMK